MAPNQIKTGKIFNRDGNVIIANRDVTQNITNIHQRALSAIEEAELARNSENKLLAEGIERYSIRLQGQADASKNLTTPYRGLLSYRVADSETFFGRGEAITQLLETLERGKLAILHAETGAGKTSLLEAGIVPHILIEKHLPVILRPYDISPAQALKELFLSDPSQTPFLAAAPLRDLLFKVIQILGTEIRLFIIVDQFEEFFDRVPDEERKKFINELGKCLDDASLNVHWLFALRGEAFTKLSDFRPRIRSPFDNEYALKKLTRTEAELIITAPAQKFNLTFEEELVPRLLDDLGKDQIAPPQLQIVCSALVKSLPKGQTVFTNARYQQAGTVKGILVEYLSRVIDQYKPEERVIVRRVLEALVSSVPKRVLRPYSDLSNYLEKFGIPRQELNSILTKLTEDRLLRVSETDSGLNYELIHDYLLEEIQLDLEIKKRKQAEELLEQAFQNWSSDKILMGKDTLNKIELQISNLILDQARIRFLYYSASQVKNEKDLRVWKKLVTPETKEKIIAEWGKSIFSQNVEQRGIAEKILTPFWKDFLFPKGLYLFSKRFLIENRLKFLVLFLGFAILAAIFWSQFWSWVEIIDQWKPITSYSEQCLDNAGSPIAQISSDFFKHKIIAVSNENQRSICVTTDNGGSWFNLVLPGYGQEVHKIQCVQGFLFVLLEKELVYKPVSDDSVAWEKVNLTNSAPGKIFFAVHPENMEELWLANGDGFLYHTMNRGGLWEKISKLPTTNAITAMGTDGMNVAVAAGQELWALAKSSGTFFPVTPDEPINGEIKAIEPSGPNVYYVLVEHQGIFILNVESIENATLSQGVDWKKPEIAAITASHENMIITNGQDLQCLNSIIRFVFFAPLSWSTTSFCQ
jgi:hypothetical protein